MKNKLKIFLDKAKPYLNKVGEYRREIWVTSYLFFSLLLIFGVSRLAWLEHSREPIKIYPPEAFSATTSPNVSKVVASKKGTKYYFAWCKNTIKASNKIEFATEVAAISAGYEKAKGCK